MNYISFSILSLSMVLSFTSAPALAHSQVPGQVTVSRATELAAHRIERLVTLNRLDPLFLSNLQMLKAERVSEGDAIFKISAFTEKDAANQASSIVLLSDKQGKVLSHTVGAVFQPVNPVAWPIKDAVTLFEDALHFVLDGWVQHPELKPYYLGLMTITLHAMVENGQLVAHFSVTSDDDPRTLHIKLKTDGTLISHEIK